MPEVRDQVLSKVVPEELKMQLSKYFGSIEEVNRNIKNVWVESLPNSSKNVLSVLMNKGLGHCGRSESGTQLYCWKPSYGQILTPGAGHTLAIQALNTGFRSLLMWQFPLVVAELSRLALADGNVVQTINRYISRQSTVIAGHSHDLISSIAGVGYAIVN